MLKHLTLRNIMLVPVVALLDLTIRAVGLADAWVASAEQGVWDEDRP